MDKVLRKNRPMQKRGDGEGIKFKRMTIAVTKELYAKMVAYEESTGESPNWSNIARRAFEKFLTNGTF